MTLPDWSDPAVGPSTVQGGRSAAEVALAIGQFGARHFPDRWFGVCFDQTMNKVWVQRTPGGDLDRQALDDVRHPGVEIEFVNVMASRKDFAALTERIMETDRFYWEAKGVDIRDARVSEDGAGVVVVALGAQDEIRARYFPLVIKVRPY
ncbi:hypothetical protein [Kitasatospora sp. NPDC008115]|uniref:hypothetical protein n=1 Tax=Kitasatospora sp. NPDC008115 TaxID=3364022 RepID=UPI0036E39A58